MVKWRSHHPRNDLAAKECVASVQRFFIQTAHHSDLNMVANRPIEVEHLSHSRQRHQIVAEDLNINSVPLADFQDDTKHHPSSDI